MSRIVVVTAVLYNSASLKSETEGNKGENLIDDNWSEAFMPPRTYSITWRFFFFRSSLLLQVALAATSTSICRPFRKLSDPALMHVCAYLCKCATAVAAESSISLSSGRERHGENPPSAPTNLYLSCFILKYCLFSKFKHLAVILTFWFIPPPYPPHGLIQPFFHVSPSLPSFLITFSLSLPRFLITSQDHSSKISLFSRATGWASPLDFFRNLSRLLSSVPSPPDLGWNPLLVCLPSFFFFSINVSSC